ncbi:DUF2585 family protein [Rhizobium sp. YIM 134829]|uniref:DUF2585 family protein n=1 Tax=Rhizobium sp. YIM 134829 TaxID=3390453 RepID=UPI0039790E77
MYDKNKLTSCSDREADAALIFCLLVCGSLLLLQVSFLVLLGRNWVCSCGEIRLWQGTLDPVHNSQQLADPYTLLHVVFGCVLFLWLSSVRPRWPLGRMVCYAVASSVIWEIIENVPLMVRLFSNEGGSLHYSGDSIGNSLSDTVAVCIGFSVSARLAKSLTAALVIGLECLTFFTIGDSILAGALRLLRVTVSP